MRVEKKIAGRLKAIHTTVDLGWSPNSDNIIGEASLVTLARLQLRFSVLADSQS